METSTHSNLEASEHVLALLNRLHRESEGQEKTFDVTAYGTDAVHDVTRDKFIALDQDKCHFLYQICRTINAKNVVEAGTSFGVSTIYLGLAVTRNIQATGGVGTVIGTEHEQTKAARAHGYWSEAGPEVSQYIDLRVGDLCDTLKSNVPELDLVLIDIWAPMALPALQMVLPRLRYGAVLLVDNIVKSVDRYRDLLAFIQLPESGFINLTLPYKMGFGMSVYVPRDRRPAG